MVPTLFRFERTLDPIACVALLVSLLTGSCQLMAHLAGAQVELLAPGQVEIRRWGNWTTVYAPMSYANSARYNGVVVSETVVLELPEPSGGTTAELHWQWFVRTDYSQESSTIVTEADAQAFTVEGNSATSHQTAFFPRNQPCLECTNEERFRDYLHWDDFLKAADASDRVNLKFTVAQAEGDPLVVECYMPLDDNMRRYMQENAIFARTCVVAS